MRKSFTLIELLVVIVIIGICAAVLLGTINGVKSNASKPLLQVEWTPMQGESGKRRFSRTKTPEGWLILHNYSGYLTYVPDPTHEWSLPLKVEDE